MADQDPRMCGHCNITEDQAEKLKRGKYIDWKIPLSLLIMLMVSIGWNLIGQWHAVKANTEFRVAAAPKINTMATQIEVTNQILCRIETQLRIINEHYITNHFRDSKSNGDAPIYMPGNGALRATDTRE